MNFANHEQPILVVDFGESFGEERLKEKKIELMRFGKYGDIIITIEGDHVFYNNSSDDYFYNSHKNIKAWLKTE